MSNPNVKELEKNGIIFRLHFSKTDLPSCILPLECFICGCKLRSEVNALAHARHPHHLQQKNRFSQFFNIIPPLNAQSNVKLSCKFCNIQLSWDESKEHIQKHNVASWLKPDNLSQTFFRNYISQHRNSVFKCNLCGFLYGSWFHAIDHLKDSRHTNKWNATSAATAEYASYENSDMQFNQLICNRIFIGVSKLYYCHFCNMSFDSIEEAISHTAIFDHKNLVMRETNAIFKFKNPIPKNMEWITSSHLLIVMKDKIYCKICDIYFTELNEINPHMETHESKQENTSAVPQIDPNPKPNISTTPLNNQQVVPISECKLQIPEYLHWVVTGHKVLVSHTNLYCTICKKLLTNNSAVEGHLQRHLDPSWQKSNLPSGYPTSSPDPKSRAQGKSRWNTPQSEILTIDLTDSEPSKEESLPFSKCKLKIPEYLQWVVVGHKVIVNENSLLCTICKKCLMCNNSVEDHLKKHIDAKWQQANLPPGYPTGPSVLPMEKMQISGPSATKRTAANSSESEKHKFQKIDPNSKPTFKNVGNSIQIVPQNPQQIKNLSNQLPPIPGVFDSVTNPNKAQNTKSPAVYVANSKFPGLSGDHPPVLATSGNPKKQPFNPRPNLVDLMKKNIPSLMSNPVQSPGANSKNNPSASTKTNPVIKPPINSFPSNNPFKPPVNVNINVNLPGKSIQLNPFNKSLTIHDTKQSSNNFSNPSNNPIIQPSNFAGNKIPNNPNFAVKRPLLETPAIQPLNNFAANRQILNNPTNRNFAMNQQILNNPLNQRNPVNPSLNKIPMNPGPGILPTPNIPMIQKPNTNQPFNSKQNPNTPQSSNQAGKRIPQLPSQNYLLNTSIMIKLHKANYLFFTKNEIYEMSAEKRRRIILSSQLSFFGKFSQEYLIYCVVCEKSIAYNLQNVYEHWCSTPHNEYLTKLEEDDRQFKTYPNQFSCLALSKEFTVDSPSDQASSSDLKWFTCAACDDTVPDQDSMLQQHFQSEKHRMNVQRLRRHSEKICKEIFPLVESSWYSMEKYSCWPCRKFLANESPFVDHLESKKHMTTMQAMSIEKRRNHFFDSCAVCGSLWFGDRDEYTKHCQQDSIHRDLTRNIEDRIDYLPEEASALLNSPESVIAKLMEEVEKVHYEQGKESELIRSLELAVQRKFREAKAYPFGSRVTGLGLSNSDIDIFLDCGGFYDGNFEQHIDLIDKIHHCLQLDSQAWSVEKIIETSRTPIIKVYHSHSQLKCDVSFSNGLSVENTKLLKCYLDAFPQCKEMILFVKKWMFYCNISGSRHITNYAMSWFVIFYLQRRELVPSVASLMKDNPQPRTISGWPVGCRGFIVPESSRSLSSKELLKGFYSFCADFDYRFTVACPLLGEIKTKKEFLYLQLLPDEMKPYVEIVSNETDPEFFRIDSPMCIQDPYDLSHNLTKGVKKVIVNRFRKLCAKSVRLLSSN